MSYRYERIEVRKVHGRWEAKIAKVDRPEPGQLLAGGDLETSWGWRSWTRERCIHKARRWARRRNAEATAGRDIVWVEPGDHPPPPPRRADPVKATA